MSARRKIIIALLVAATVWTLWTYKQRQRVPMGCWVYTMNAPVFQESCGDDRLRMVSISSEGVISLNGYKMSGPTQLRKTVGEITRMRKDRRVYLIADKDSRIDQILPAIDALNSLTPQVPVGIIVPDRPLGCSDWILRPAVEAR